MSAAASIPASPAPLCSPGQLGKRTCTATWASSLLSGRPPGESQLCLQELQGHRHIYLRRPQFPCQQE